MAPIAKCAREMQLSSSIHKLFLFVSRWWCWWWRWRRRKNHGWGVVYECVFGGYMVSEQIPLMQVDMVDCNAIGGECANILQCEGMRCGGHGTRAMVEFVPISNKYNLNYISTQCFGVCVWRQNSPFIITFQRNTCSVAVAAIWKNVNALREYFCFPIVIIKCI